MIKGVRGGGFPVLQVPKNVSFRMPIGHLTSGDLKERLNEVNLLLFCYRGPFRVPPMDSETLWNRYLWSKIIFFK